MTGLINRKLTKEGPECLKFLGLWALSRLAVVQRLGLGPRSVSSHWRDAGSSLASAGWHFKQTYRGLNRSSGEQRLNHSLERLAGAIQFRRISSCGISHQKTAFSKEHISRNMFRFFERDLSVAKFFNTISSNRT